MAITNFEDQTHELTEYELKTLLPLMVKGLKTKVGVNNSITSTEIVKILKAAGYKIDPARVRKLVNHIRVNNEIYNLVATGKGYHVATSESECRLFIKSLDERINSIITVRDAMQYQLNKSIENQKK